MKKLVVITGASSGFGKEMAYLFSQAGHPLLLLGRREELMQAYNLPNTLVKKVDVTDYAAFEAAIRQAEEKWGKTDLLINNAGQMLLGDIRQQDTEEWRTMLSINIEGVLNGMKIVLDNMVTANRGSIINISSIAGFKGFPNHAAYCATKFGVHGLTETVRSEVANKNVRVMLISPGAAETELLSHTTDKGIVDGYNQWKQEMGGLTMDAKHVAEVALNMYQMPQEVTIREVVLAPTKQVS